MPDPRWLTHVDFAQRTRLTPELGQLVEHLAELGTSPDMRSRASRLANWENWRDPEKSRRLALALLAAIRGCRRADDWVSQTVLVATLVAVLRRNIPFSDSDIGPLLELSTPAECGDEGFAVLPGVLAAVRRTIGSRPLPAEHRQTLVSIRKLLETGDAKQRKAAAKLIDLIDKLCGESTVARLQPDEGWADELKEWVLALEVLERGRWEVFLRDAATVEPESPARQWQAYLDETALGFLRDPEAVTEARHRSQRALLPARAWQARMAQHLQTLGAEKVRERLKRSLHKIRGSKPGMLARQSLNREMLRGLLWLAIELADDEVGQAVQHAVRFFYENNSPLAETGVVVLFHMPGRAGAAPLATILGRVRAESQRAFVDSTLTALAERLHCDRDDLVDESLPTFGFTEVGRLQLDFGEAKAEMRISGSRSTDIVWSKPDGKVLKSIPARVKRERAEEVEAFKATAAGVREALSGLAQRLEASWLTERTFALADWHARLIDHPVAAALGRKLIWRIGGNGHSVAVYWRGDSLVDMQGHPVQWPAETTVGLWHPIFATENEAAVWRERLEADGVCQPFKQAHREIYRLTEAERTGRTYSNRFAAHIIRQAQFRQLAKVRGWKTGLIGPWDGAGDGVAHRRLPRQGLRAEFWTEGVEGDYQTGYTYLSTDQIRFYRENEREPMGLEDVPPLVFSEVMRDVDMFVGVASVGNDPNWSDGGPQGRYRDYWQSYAFGDLSATATTRKETLQRLVPRLKIAERCTFADRFLVVRGDLRTYKIHLGSGNVLMSPNDQYLCIVPSQSAGRKDTGKIFLPFEGDNMLSIVLSKALLLAEDMKIKDPTIVNQIQGH
jgi:hypothetical protein